MKNIGYLSYKHVYVCHILWMDWRVGLDGRQAIKLSLFVCPIGASGGRSCTVMSMGWFAYALGCYRMGMLGL